VLEVASQPEDDSLDESSSDGNYVASCTKFVKPPYITNEEIPDFEWHNDWNDGNWNDLRWKDWARSRPLISVF
jgi:hypothetical protein